MGWATQSAKRILILRLIIVIILLSISLILSNTVNGQSATWISSSLLSLKNDRIVNTQSPKTLTSYPNIDCADHEFVIRPARLLPLPQTQKSITECAVESSFGYISSSGLVHLNGTNISGQLKSNNGSTISITPIPNSSDLIQLVSNPNGSIVNYYQKIFSKLNVNKKLDGSFDFIMPSTPSWILKDKAQNTRYVKPSTIAFSDNGKWMLADSEHVAGLIVDLETKIIIPFAKPYTYHLGTNPNVHAAVDNQGKIVITTSAQGTVNITDISSCLSVPDVISAPVSCSTRQFSSFLTQQINGYRSVRKPRIVNERLISSDIVSNIAGNTKVERYRMAPYGDTIEDTDYLALGDSYQSGEGAYDYYQETDTDENMCHLSKVSYPYLIGQSLDLSNYGSVACSGAKIENIFEYVQRSTIPDPNSMGNMLPGYRTQASYIKQKNPGVITIGIGGNDIGFGGIITSCIKFGLIPGECYNNYEDRLEIIHLANKQSDRLVKIFTELRIMVPNVYVLGYPSIAKNNGDCAVNVRLDNQEVIFSNQLIDYLNLVIQTATEKAGVRFIDVSDAFNGRRMCEIDSEYSAVNGVTFGDDGPLGFGPIGNEGYHPNKLGHRLLKTAILNESVDFGAQMPAPNDSAKLPSEDSGLEILDVPKQGRSIKNLINDTTMTENTVAYNEQTSINLDGQRLGLKPNTGYKIEIHSEPFVVGTINTDSSSNAIENILIPSSIPLGMHTIHILGENILGESIDVYKAVFIANSDYDFDGDGTINELDSCQLDVNSGIDVDEDRVDDICDQSVVVPVEEELSKDAEIEDDSPSGVSEEINTTEKAAIKTPAPTEAGTSDEGNITLSRMVSYGNNSDYNSTQTNIPSSKEYLEQQETRTERLNSEVDKQTESINKVLATTDNLINDNWPKSLFLLIGLLLLLGTTVSVKISKKQNR